MNPDWMPVASTNLAAVAYEPASMRLWCRFLNGNQGYYEPVEEAVWRELLAAPSKGSFQQTRLRKGPYAWHYA